MNVISVAVEDSSSLNWALDYPVQQPSKIRQGLRVAARRMPAWWSVVETRFEQLFALPEDPRGARPLDLADVVAAVNFMARVMRDDTVVPWIGRLSSGGVQLTWRLNDVEVEAVFDRNRGESELIVSVGEFEWDAPIAAGESLFATVVDRLFVSPGEHASAG